MVGKRLSFSALVKRYSGDIPVRAMLDELVRVGAVKRLRDGRIGLVTRGYIPQKGMDQRLAILGQDTADLIATIDHNLYQEILPDLASNEKSCTIMYLWSLPRHSRQSHRRVPKKCSRDLTVGYPIATAT